MLALLYRDTMKTREPSFLLTGWLTVLLALSSGFSGECLAQETNSAKEVLVEFELVKKQNGSSVSLSTKEAPPWSYVLQRYKNKKWLVLACINM